MADSDTNITCCFGGLFGFSAETTKKLKMFFNELVFCRESVDLVCYVHASFRKSKHELFKIVYVIYRSEMVCFLRFGKGGLCI